MLNISCIARQFTFPFSVFVMSIRCSFSLQHNTMYIIFENCENNTRVQRDTKGVILCMEISYKGYACSGQRFLKNSQTSPQIFAIWMTYRGFWLIEIVFYVINKDVMFKSSSQALHKNVKFYPINMCKFHDLIKIFNA